jgi:hypothetical protein
MEQKARRNKPSQAGKKEKSKHDLKAGEKPNKNFLQSKRTKARFMNGTKNNGSITNFKKI